MTNPWRPMVRDHRDRPVPVYRLDLRWRRPEDRSELPDEVFDRIRSRLVRVSRDGMGAHPLPLVALAVFFGLLAWPQIRNTRSGWSAAWPALFMVAACIASILTYRRR